MVDDSDAFHIRALCLNKNLRGMGRGEISGREGGKIMNKSANV